MARTLLCEIVSANSVETESDNPKKVWDVVIEHHEGEDVPHYLAYQLFDDATYVLKRLICSMEGRDSKVISRYECTCTYRSIDERADYDAYGDYLNDYDDANM
jgi:hypothetical protein